MLKSLAVQIGIAALMLVLAFVFWPKFAATLTIGLVAGMVIGNLSPIEPWVEKQMTAWKNRRG